MERGNVPRVLEIDQMNNSRDNKTSTDEMNFLLCGKLENVYFLKYSIYSLAVFFFWFSSFVSYESALWDFQ